MRCHIVATAQAADCPRVDDLALAGGHQHEADLWATRRHWKRLAVFMDDQPQNHPGCELATADRRPAPAQAEAAVDDMRLTRGTRTVGRDDIPCEVHSADAAAWRSRLPAALAPATALLVRG